MGTCAFRKLGFWIHAPFRDKILSNKIRNIGVAMATPATPLTPSLNMSSFPRSFNRPISRVISHIFIYLLFQEKPHKCTMCSKSFPTPGDLKSHTYVHTGTWPFKCHICHRGFSKQTNLKNHLLLHSGMCYNSTIFMKFLFFLTFFLYPF